MTSRNVTSSVRLAPIFGCLFMVLLLRGRNPSWPSLVLASWAGQELRELSGESLDLAVSRGAAYYGQVRRGRGIRIRGGVARSYYIGIESAMPAVPGMAPPIKALCVVPFGMEEGTEAGIAEQRERVQILRNRLGPLVEDNARRLDSVADYLVEKSIWLVGGDGWAYDIGFGGLDHVLGTDRNVNILVLDTEVYSNTGGQQSKSTPLAAAAKFATLGKEIPKKSMGLMAMSYGHVYVARIAFGARDQQTVKAFLEAESYPGPSLIIAYSHCIAHGYDMAFGAEQQKRAVARSKVIPSTVTVGSGTVPPCIRSHQSWAFARSASSAELPP